MKKIVISAMLLFSFSFAAKSNICMLKPIFDACHSNAIKYGVLKNEKACKNVSSKAGAKFYETYMKKYHATKDQALKIATIFSLACYAGCMDDEKTKKEFAQCK